MSATQPAVAVEGLRIVLRDTDVDIVDEVSFSIAPGEVLGLVGESGSGKTTVGLALLGHTRRGAAIAAAASASATSTSSRSRAPLVAPCAGAWSRTCRRIPPPRSTLRCASARSCARRSRCTASARAPTSAARASPRSCARSRCPTTPRYLRRYPHELSGGQQQRIGLAMAFACRPRLIVLDEPTTGLDVTTQAHVLGTVRELAAAHHVAALYVSHDLAVVGTLATRTAVMYAGRIVELGPTGRAVRIGLASVHAPARAGDPAPLGPARADRHPRARAVARRAADRLRVRAALHVRRSTRAAATSRPCATLAPRLRVRVHPRRGGAHERRHALRPARRARRAAATVARRRARARPACSRATARVTVVHDVNLQLAPHECLALVGESGSGKTTLARSIAGLHRDRSGLISLRGRPLAESARARHARGAAVHPVRLPEPVRLAQPAQDDRPDRAPAARRVRDARPAPRPTGA